MSKIVFITGGQRSGKSRYAQALAEKWSQTPIYLATARYWDEDFKKRIERHRSDRGEHWKTIEEEKYIGSCSLTGQTVVMDCVTLWLTNIFHDHKFNIENALKEAQEEWDKFINQHFNLVVISNELGMGIHAENEVSRKFADLQGWINQYIAERSDETYLMVSGIPVKIK